MIDPAEAGLVRFVFPHKGVWGTAVLRCTGLSIKHYLAAQPLGELHLISRWKRLKIEDKLGKRLRLRHVPAAGDTVLMRYV